MHVKAQPSSLNTTILPTANPCGKHTIDMGIEVNRKILRSPCRMSSLDAYLHQHHFYSISFAPSPLQLDPSPPTR
ncbi:unnamed protein product [Protopolystoma xenopodis]|uniref:Uncharacterized protein n=1 Tax=Protopolystoma xenopodis TaxID=117903 RepID=A0A448X580_9PLAT|nr:unnamed protein product [Protopolystoma xenopodis]